DMHYELISAEGLYLSAAEEKLWRALELNCDLGGTLREPFPGADIEGNSGPPPVIDVQFHRHECLGRRLRIYLRFAAISGDRFFRECARTILAAHRLGKHIF